MQERKTNGIGYFAGDWPLDPEKSTIIFFHGAGGSAVFWQAQVEGLAVRANTLAIDLPGHGKSDGKGKDKVEDYARAVANFMKEINVPNPIPCGLSMGGAIALQLLLDCPDLLRAGILLNTGAKLKVAPEIFDLLGKDYNGYIEMIGRLVASKSPNSDQIAPFKENSARCKPEVTLGDFRACNRFDVMQRIASITLPVLVVSAADDQLTPPKYGEFLENMIPNACRSHIEKAGHIVPMEKPEEFNSVIIKFLDRASL
jgi:pimeloyl-ACP methyl ester carboxylesterase